MNKRSEHLGTLGLHPDATWDEVTEAYRDLMRVWHPDRFQSDERWRKKAEEQAQRINHAMSELRKMGKSPPKKPFPSSSPEFESTYSKQKTQQRPEANQTRQNRDQSDPHTSQRKQEADQNKHTHGNFSFSIAPLLIYANGSRALLRGLIALAIFYICYDALKHSSSTQHQQAFILAVAFAALDFSVHHICAVISMSPLATVDRTGLFFLKTGKLNWIDVETVWPVIGHRSSNLNINLSKHHLSKHNPIARMIFRIKRALGPAHVTIPFTGLTAGPADIVSAMKLRQVHNDLEIREIPLRFTRLIFILQLLSLAACAIAFCRCLLGSNDLARFDLSNIECAIYFSVFVISRTAEHFSRASRKKIEKA